MNIPEKSVSPRLEVDALALGAVLQVYGYTDSNDYIGIHLLRRTRDSSAELRRFRFDPTDDPNARTFSEVSTVPLSRYYFFQTCEGEVGFSEARVSPLLFEGCRFYDGKHYINVVGFNVDA